MIVEFDHPSCSIICFAIAALIIKQAHLHSFMQSPQAKQLASVSSQRMQQQQQAAAAQQAAMYNMQQQYPCVGLLCLSSLSLRSAQRPKRRQFLPGRTTAFAES